MSEGVINALLIAAMGVMLVASIYLKRRRMEKTLMGKVAVIYSEINSNRRILDSFDMRRRYKKLKTGAWKRNRNKLGIVPQELIAEMADAFDMAEDYNQRIAAAKSFQSESYMAGIDVGKLKPPFDRCAEKLYAWVQENMDNPELAPPKKRGLFGL